MRTRTPGCSGRRTTRSAIAMLKQLGIVGRRDDEAGAGVRRAMSSNAAAALHAVVAGEGGGLAVLVRCSSAATTSRCRAASVGEGLRRAGRCLQRRERGRELRDQRGGGVELASPSSRVRGSDAMQIGCFAAPELAELRAERRERAGKARGCRACGRGPRRTARSKRRDRARMRALGGAEP